MIRDKDYKAYFDWQASEMMNSTGQAPLVEESVKYVNYIQQNIKTILCVGVGDGYEMKQFNEAGYKTKGITLNLDAIKYPDLDVVKMDMHTMTYKDNRFDMVYAKDVFEHSFSHWQALREMARVASRFVLILLPDPVSWAKGKYHTIVPYRNQMEALGSRFNLELSQTWVFQNFGPVTGYLFKK